MKIIKVSKKLYLSKLLLTIPLFIFLITCEEEIPKPVITDTHVKILEEMRKLKKSKGEINIEARAKNYWLSKKEQIDEKEIIIYEEINYAMEIIGSNFVGYSESNGNEVLSIPLVYHIGILEGPMWYIVFSSDGYTEARQVEDVTPHVKSSEASIQVCQEMTEKNWFLCYSRG